MVVMFDTVAFNRILDGSVSLGQLKPGVVIYATHIQEDELNNTAEPARRSNLQRIFREFVGRETSTESLILGASKLGKAKLSGEGKISTETSVWGISRWGEGKWAAEGGLYASTKARLDELKKKENNIQDALIAETAIVKKLCLVTDDKTLVSVTKEYGGQVLSFAEFLKIAIQECSV